MKKHHVSTSSEKKLRKRFERASKANSPEKKSARCSDLITVPQSNLNTCWFNAVLMVFLFSDGMRSVCKKALRFLATKKINPGVNDILQRLISLLLIYKQPNRQKIYEKSFEYGIKPEDILESIDAYAPGMFPPDVIVGTSGGYPDKATLVLLQLFGLKARFYSLESDHTGYVLTDVSHLQPPSVVSYSPDMLIVYRHYYAARSGTAARVSSLQPPKLSFGGRKYVLDSCLLSSIVKKKGHAIAGVTCNEQRMMYNGWVRNNDSLHVPCPLIPVDWTRKGVYLQKAQKKACYTSKRISPMDYKFDATSSSQIQMMFYT
jgi:hypothetical protein